MALRGTAAIVILFDRRPNTIDLFRHWHDTEHMPERMGIPGFQRGRRFRLMDRWQSNGGREFLIVYEASDMGVLVGEDYLQRLNNPTELSKKVGPMAMRNIRGTCAVRYSSGLASGGVMGLIRFREDTSRGHDANARIIRELGTISEQPGIMTVHWCETDVEASEIEVEERKNRSIEIPASFILIEAVDEHAAGNALRTLVDGGRLQHDGVTELSNDGVYMLESDIFPTATAWGA